MVEVLCTIGILLSMPGGEAPPAPSVALGFIVDARGETGPEARAARSLAEKLGGTAVSLAGDGTLRGADGAAVPRERLAVLWCHRGDSAELPSWLAGAASIGALKRHVEAGGGLLLSGAALALVHPLGLEPVPPRRGGPGRDDYVAAIIPEDWDHPAFAGLRPRLPFSPGRLEISEGGLPAFSDFQGSGGPAGGRLLARAACAGENPLVEYASGKGRVIALGWRLPHYGNAANRHRGNLERLTGNILAYLADPRIWRSAAPRAPGRTEAGDPTAPSPESIRLAILDLAETFGDRYPRAAEFLARLEGIERERREAGSVGEEAARRLEALRREALLANPLLDFDRILLVDRDARTLGLPANWDSNSTLPRTGFDDRIAVLSARGGKDLVTVYRPEGGRFVGDLDLHWSADRLLFSMPGSNGRWQVHELALDGSGRPPRELPLILEPDVDNYDACYLPDGRVLFTSTATFLGVPCVDGSSHITNLYLLGRDGIRQVTVDQEHDWCPEVLNDGRVLYLRWEYADLPHAHSRILFHMNPDGTGQMEHFGSNSYFPNSFFYARPIPGHPTAVAGIATGHHGNARSGRLLIVDPARGRREAGGVVAEIPGRGKTVEAIIRDELADGVWPQFLHPFPLSAKHFLVAARPSPARPWGIYLTDVFDNLLLLEEVRGRALLEPVPILKRQMPPAIPDRVDLARRDALVFLTDVYRGGGLRGVPRGTVRRLRLVTYRFGYRGMGGLLGTIGMDGPWDIKHVLGTVPVGEDGSAFFRVPASTPISVQPLDAEGKALQLMRSWFTAMPGEVVTCGGCHEEQDAVARSVRAPSRPPAEIEPWRGTGRGFGFAREVQPVLDRRCAGCHDGRPREGRSIPDLRGGRAIADWSSGISGHAGPGKGGKFSSAYAELHRFVRRPGIEDDIHMLATLEYHADATELVQILRKGHHGVALDPAEWERIATWIDLNAPYHGTWTEIAGADAVRPVAARAREMRRRYTGMDEDWEIVPPAPPPAAPIIPAPIAEPPVPEVAVEGWPFDAAEASRRQGPPAEATRPVDLGGGTRLDLVRIPAGSFLMGSRDGHLDERPVTTVTIERPYWIGRLEVTNEQLARFDPLHDSHVEPMHGYQFGQHGYPANGPRQPAVRVSWERAREFCRWLSAQTGSRFDLPTEAQWEWACRAGTATPFSFGGLEADYSPFANLGDVRLREFALDTYVRVRLVEKPGKYDDWIPRDDRFDDGGFISADSGSYRPNPWGLHDAHGNVWEWTRSSDRPFPYADGDGRNGQAPGERRVVRGGSWYDRPERCTSSFRLAYWTWQGVFNVGFRVVQEE